MHCFFPGGIVGGKALWEPNELLNTDLKQLKKKVREY